MTPADDDPPEDRPRPRERRPDGDRPAGLVAAEDRRRHRLALDGGDEEAEPGERAEQPVPAAAPDASSRRISRRVVWMATTSSAKLASASGPSVRAR